MEKEITNAFVKSNDLGKILIFAIIVLVIMVGSIVMIQQDNINKQLDIFSKQGKSLENLNKNITVMLIDKNNIEVLRKEVYSSYLSADRELEEVTRVLGLILQGNKIPFPQNLNMALKDFRSAFKDINTNLLLIKK